MAAAYIIFDIFVYVNILAVSLLAMPLAFAFIVYHGLPVYPSLNPGNEIGTASKYAFQSDTFSAAGAIGSLAGDKSDPIILTGRWNLDVNSGTVSAFSANLTMVNASGQGYGTIQLSNMSSSEVIIHENGTTFVTGVLDLTVNGTERSSDVNATISFTKFRGFSMALGVPHYLAGPV